MSEDQASTQTICQRLAIAAYSLMDHGRYDEAAELFADDAVWVRGGNPVEGREGIRESLHSRPADQVTRHIITNVLVQAERNGSASATACFMPFRGSSDGGKVGPPVVGDLVVKFRRYPEGWRITHMKPSIIFG